MEIKNCKYDSTYGDVKSTVITISMEEYKELLMIKGRYEELKNMYLPSYPKTNITYRGPETFKSPYTVTCGNYDAETLTAGYCAMEEATEYEPYEPIDTSDLEEFIQEA